MSLWDGVWDWWCVSDEILDIGERLLMRDRQLFEEIYRQCKNNILRALKTLEQEQLAELRNNTLSVSAMPTEQVSIRHAHRTGQYPPCPQNRSVSAMPTEQVSIRHAHRTGQYPPCPQNRSVSAMPTEQVSIRHVHRTGQYPA